MTITFEIFPDGEVKMHVQGVPGQKCIELTKEFEKELGIVKSQEKTEEYFQQEVHEEQRLLR